MPMMESQAYHILASLAAEPQH
jgi:hypothetical protein